MVGSLRQPTAKIASQKKGGWDWEKTKEKMIISEQPSHFQTKSQNQKNDQQQQTSSDEKFLKTKKMVQNPLKIPDLSVLSDMDRVYIQEAVQMQQFFCGYKNQKNYNIMNPAHEQFWTATEETDFWSRLCQGPLLRPFDLVVRDELGRRVLNLSKDAGDCCCCYWPCCFCCSFQSLEIYCGQQPEIFVGKVQQQLSLIGATNLIIVDEEGKNALRVKGPHPGGCSPIFGSCCSWGEEVFEILAHSSDGAGAGDDEDGDRMNEIVGKIVRKTSPPCLGEVCSDKYEILFPSHHHHLDTKMKATILSTAFLIDLIYFEFFQRQQRPNHFAMHVGGQKGNVLFY